MGELKAFHKKKCALRAWVHFFDALMPMLGTALRIGSAFGAHACAPQRTPWSGLRRWTGSFSRRTCWDNNVVSLLARSTLDQPVEQVIHRWLGAQTYLVCWMLIRTAEQIEIRGLVCIAFYLLHETNSKGAHAAVVQTDRWTDDLLSGRPARPARTSALSALDGSVELELPQC